MTVYFNRQHLPDWTPTLAQLPEDQGVVVFMRHSVRPEIPEGKFGMQVDLTAEGVQAAQELGAAFGQRLRKVSASASTRCVQTGRALIEGAGVALEVQPDETLGEPGAFIEDVEASIQRLVEHGPIGIVNRLLQGLPLEGMIACEPGVRAMLSQAWATPPDAGTVHVCITHDTLLSALLGWLEQKEAVQEEEWPQMLEGCLMWRTGSGLKWVWRGTVYQRDLPDAWLSSL